ncbi:MAG TPA: hypothetical protein PLE48_06760 [Thiobacillus sp.]|nr:MAG: hypothetical protein B7Y50_08525 [Hydrogenophilales bacterium 28-61-11]OYZ57670.1 MAG: hypothetical protein B7Y21_06630 [Hydrogenophilales bacterium 16-61-112]OZA49875.1 MAG: hypothetical protein B7X81_02200 [Hydrogenophilales bacterium 17-61-76]HQT30919.1 hypothetical protein [Thiobacillus sp.]HQT70105.1 hypothetical protein [Thiobacillus sp.]
MTISDVVLHVDETLDARARHNLEDQMRSIEGVISPGFNERTPHLMVVAYNPDRVRAVQLLDAVTHQGYHAQYCGMI